MAQFRKPRLKLGTTSNSIYLNTDDQDKTIIRNNDKDIIEISGITTNSTFKIKSSEPKLEIYNDTNNYAELSLGVTGKDDWKILSGYKDKTDSEANLHIKRGSRELISLNVTGVGINVTDPIYAFEVSGLATFRNRVNVQGSLVLGGGTDLDESSPLIWKNGESTGQFYSIDSASIGIGVSHPDYKLEVNGDFGVSGSIYTNNDSLYDIGTTTNKFNTLYINNINISGKILSNINDKVNIDSNTRINGNLDIEGDLNVFGNAITFDTETIQVEDNMIALSTNNSGDVVDNGFYSQFYNGSVTKYTGLIRDATDGIYKLFTNLEIEPDTTIDISHPSFNLADLSVGNIYSNGSLVSSNSWEKSNNDIYYNSGNIGIGITTPTNGKLEVSGNYGSVSLTNYGELTQSGFGLGDSGTYSYSIYADGKIAASEFNAVSDIRTKKIISERDINKDIDFIKNINIYDYEFIDKHNYSEYSKIGFIAQELFDLNKNLISKSKKFIPNIFNIFDFKNNIIYIETDDLSVSDIIKIEIRLKNNTTKCLNVNILEKENTYIKIDLDSNLDIDYSSRLFIYGKLVNDFMTVDINQVLSMNTNLIKYLLEKNNSLEKRIQKIEEKIN